VIVSTETQRAIGIGSAAVAVVALLFHNAIHLPIDESPHLTRFLVLSVLCVAVAAAIFLVVLPIAEASPDTTTRLARQGWILSLLSLVAMIVFFTGLPFVLGAGAFVLGELAEERAAAEIGRSEGGPREDESHRSATHRLETLGAERASLAWAAALTGGLVFVACLALFAITVAAR
jgi:hypothetical protein